MSRREFVATSTLTAVAALLAAACGDGIIGATAPGGTAGGPAGSFTFRLTDFPALANIGGIARANAGTLPIALVRTGATTISAFSLVCPHQGTTVNIAGAGFRCPNHGATFNSAGTWTGGQQTGNLAAIAAMLDTTAGIITVGAPGGTPGQPGQPAQPGGSVSLVVRIASFPALGTVGGVARVDGGTGVPIGVARTGTSSFVAYTLACTHQGTTVQLIGSGWRCPNHFATFDATGRVTTGPATTNLAALTVAYDAAAGTLSISGSAPRPPGGGDDDDDDDHG